MTFRDIVPRSPQQQVDHELEFHVEMRTRELIAKGIGPGLGLRTACEDAGGNDDCN